MTFRSLAVLFQLRTMAYFFESATAGKIVGKRGNFAMTQLNAASRPLRPHVASKAESEQTRKHWSLLTTSDPG